jgi:hypothetical protein
MPDFDATKVFKFARPPLEPTPGVKSGVMKRQEEDERDELTILAMLEALQGLEDPVRPPAEVIAWPKAAQKESPIDRGRPRS